MKLNSLIQELVSRSVRLSVDSNNNLSISAENGVVGDDLVSYIRHYKKEIIELLNESNKQKSDDKKIQPDKYNVFKEFPFSDLQFAFFMANDPHMDYQVQPHYYTENDDSSLDITRYENAIKKSLERHRYDAVLASSSRTLSVLEELPKFYCKVHDLRGLEEEDVTRKLLDIRASMMRKEPDLNRWPWMDVAISIWHERGDDRYRIHTNFNNFYTDGFGADLFQKEVKEFYKYPNKEIPPLNLCYRDAILGLAELADSNDGKSAKKYWTDRLPYLPDPPELPQKTGVNRKQRSNLNRREGTLPAHIWRSLKDNGKKYSLTPTSIIIAAYSEVLSIWSGSDHFVLSNMVTRRLPIHPQITEVFGNFASLYPLEVDLRGNPTFAGRCKKLQNQILSDSENRQWGGMQVMQALNQIKGEFGSVPCPLVVGSGLFLKNFKKADFSCLETAQTLLDHQFWQLEDGSYYYVWDVIEEFFPENLIDDMWSSYRSLLYQLAENPQLWESSTFDRIMLSNEHNNSKSVSEKGEHYNSNKLDLPLPNIFLDDLFLQSLEKQPDKPALIINDISYSYRWIEKRSDLLFNILYEYVVNKGSVVAIVLDRSAWFLSSILASLRLGCVYLPIDPGYPDERIRFLIENSSAKVVISESKYLEKISKNNDVKVIGVDKIDSEVNSSSYPVKANDSGAYYQGRSVDDIAYIIYTSGSTGRPKGVMIDHVGALNTIRDIGRRFEVTSNDKILGISSSSFDLSVYDVFGSFDAGATLVYPSKESANNPVHWLELMAKHEISVWNSAPPLMVLLVETAIRQNVTLPGLRLVLLSGDWIPLDLPGQIKEVAPNATIVSLGGATEASIWSVYYVIDEIDSTWKSIPYGKPLSNQYCHILDSQNRIVPCWTTGELHISGVGVSHGYWKEPDKTEKSFILPGRIEEKIYKTGDLARYLPDGNIELLGRLDDQVKIQGFRIELGEVEKSIIQFDLVENVVVLALRRTKTDQGGREKRSNNHQLVAYIVPSNSNQNCNEKYPRNLEEKDFVELVKEHAMRFLPDYMVPSSWIFLDVIPITSNGKIDRKALLQMKPSVNVSHSKDKLKSFRPRDIFESELADMYKDIFDTDTLYVSDDFFELGGQSFDGIRLVSMVKERFGKNITLADIWSHRTIEDIAGFIRSDINNENRMSRLHKGRVSDNVFAIHPGGGEIIGYYDLANLMDASFYAISAKYEDVLDGRLSSVKDIAKRYIEYIITVQPDGPYTLMGWSSGACIAFEIAAQLEASGFTINHLFVLDSPAPITHRKLTKQEMYRSFFEDLGIGLDVSVVDDVGINSYDDETLLFREITGKINDKNGPEERHGHVILNANELYPLFEVFRGCVNSIRNFEPGEVLFDITVFRALDGVVSEFNDYPYMNSGHWGWKTLTEGNVYEETVLGTHHTMLKDKGASVIADAINNSVSL